MSSLKDLSNDLADLVDKSSKSVVRVDARRGRAGTGIVWDSGLILTANHVVEQEDDIEVVVGEKSSKATLVGRDPATDIALLKIDDGLTAPAMSRAKVHIEEYGANAPTNAMRSRMDGWAAARSANDPPTHVPSRPLLAGSMEGWSTNH